MDNTKIKSKNFIDALNIRQPNEKLKYADRDLESLMAARDRRASKYGITVEETFTDYGGYSETSSYRDNRYVVTHEKIYMKHSVGFKKDNRYLYKHDSDLVSCEIDVVDVLDPNKLPAEAYICPNCGVISSAEELASSGCPSCGTHFSIPQLYPKVSHFTYTEGRTDLTKDVPRKIWKPLIIIWIICYIPLYLVSFQMWETYNWLAGLVFAFAMIPVAAIPVYFVYAVLTYFTSLGAMFSDKKQRDMKKEADKKTDFSSGVFEKAMAKFGPIFNFQYFSSRVYNLLGAMIYAEDPSECPFYSGPEFIGRFDKIIDYVPVGMEIKSFTLSESGKCSIVAKVIANVYSYVDSKIQHRKVEVTLKASKNMNYPIDINFSAHTYKCDGCGSSYDVTKKPVCPYCGRPHDLLDEEWYIDGEVKGEFKQHLG